MTLSAFCGPIAAAFDTGPSDGQPDLAAALQVEGKGDLPSYFAVTDLAVATIGMAGLALARLKPGTKSLLHPVTVDRRLASFWFGTTVRPTGWTLPDVWDEIAGNYRASDGWIRLHTNAPKHRAAGLAILKCAANKRDVGQAVSGWLAGDLEEAVLAAGGCAAVMRSLEGWADHPQGAAVAGESLVLWQRHDAVAPDRPDTEPARPLAGVRVLDLTRILSGPVATRFLAGFGADVLRIDPPGWDEPAAAPEVTLGKRCAGLDLSDRGDREVFERLLAQADILLHGYRPGALEGLGYGPAQRRRRNPGLVDVCLDAYGWSGPWAGRRGFDSLVQMSSGIAAHGMKKDRANGPVPLPVQALDHGTGYLLAAAVLHALHKRRTEGSVLSARLSLARTAHLLASTARDAQEGTVPVPEDADLEAVPERTDWGPARRVRFPMRVGALAPSWRYPAGRLRSASPAFETAV